jgi:hypothetical protein
MESKNYRAIGCTEISKRTGAIDKLVNAILNILPQAPEVEFSRAAKISGRNEVEKDGQKHFLWP